jgi:aminoglycoside 6'-N-acetyltransferase
MAHPQTDPTLHGSQVRLRPATVADIPALAVIRGAPEVYRWWRGGEDLAESIAGELADEGDHSLVIEHGERIVGAIQWSAQEDPEYRHASIDVYLDVAAHGRGLGTDAVRTLARHLIVEHGHHRLTIDPAADNAAAIRCYAKVGFRPVGLMRQYERGPDGVWHDALLMDLLAAELTEPDPRDRRG